MNMKMRQAEKKERNLFRKDLLTKLISVKDPL